MDEFGRVVVVVEGLEEFGTVLVMVTGFFDSVVVDGLVVVVVVVVVVGLFVVVPVVGRVVEDVPLFVIEDGSPAGRVAAVVVVVVVAGLVVVVLLLVVVGVRVPGLSAVILPSAEGFATAEFVPLGLDKVEEPEEEPPPPPDVLE